MAVTLQSADNALKTVYLDVIAEQLNTNTNPFLSAIKQSTENVWGKEIKKLVTFGANGGIGAGTEDGSLPTAMGNNYSQFVTTLKNLYGTIEISDKAVRASENNSGAFVNLLNAEMEGLIKSSTFNFSRMLFGDGTGKLSDVKEVYDGIVGLDENCRILMEGMLVDFYTSQGVAIEGAQCRKILKIDREYNEIYLSGSTLTEEIVPSGSIMTMHGAYGNELTGLKAIFNTSTPTLYGLERASNSWLNPYINPAVGEITEEIIQKAIDTIEEQSGVAPNFIICSWGVRRSLQKLFAKSNTRIDTVNLAGGFTAMSYNGIPIVVDRFCPDSTMYLLNTNDFALHQLCDWQWLEGDDGRVLKQVPGKPVYSATLVKYAELLCERPCGQGMLKGIKES